MNNIMYKIYQFEINGDSYLPVKLDEIYRHLHKMVKS